MCKKWESLIAVEQRCDRYNIEMTIDSIDGIYDNEGHKAENNPLLFTSTVKIVLIYGQVIF